MSEKTVLINDLSIFSDNFDYMRCATLCLNVLTFLRNKTDNTVTISATELRSAVSDKKAVSARTLRGWLLILARSGAIKYSGNDYVINPLYVFEGTEAQFRDAVERWNNFQTKTKSVKYAYIVI